MLRPQQVTLGSLILGAHSDAHAFGELSVPTMTELSIIIKNMESTLTRCFKYDKINYLMLMMVDPHVHFHVIPRYSKVREFISIQTLDTGWPGPPDLSQEINLSQQQKDALLEYIRYQWVVDEK